MKKVCWPYYDPDFDSLPERINGPACRVTIDNESLEDCTIVMIDSVNKQGLLLEVVQVLTDMNLTISKSYVSSDAGWLMDVFHLRNDRGTKITDQRIINYIQQAISANRDTSPKATARDGLKSHPRGPKVIEMTGKDRPGLLSEISAALADLHCNIVEAHAWSHNSRFACVAYISDQSMETPIDDRRLQAIEDHLSSVLRATTNQGDDYANQQEVKPADDIPVEALGTTTNVERRLHQLMISVHDNDRPSRDITANTMRRGLDSDEDRNKASVSIESCEEKGYTIATIQCKDRRKLMFDTVCTLTDMQYAIFHASIDSHGGCAYQEYFIRHIDGCALNTESEKQRVIKCLEAAIERRVCEGVRLEVCAYDRVGLLSDITRILRENGLAVVRADSVTHGDKAVNAFYVRDISGNNVDMSFIQSMKREMGANAIHLAVKDERKGIRPPSSSRSSFSIRYMLKSQIERFSHNFVAI